MTRTLVASRKCPRLARAFNVLVLSPPANRKGSLGGGIAKTAISLDNVPSMF